MRSRFGISVFATAIAGSAVAHALVLVTFSTVRVGPPEVPRGFAEMTVVFDGPQTQPAPVASELDIGQPRATGYATHDLDGRREQLAPEAPQDQPSLSLDPVGNSLVVEVPSAPGGAAGARGIVEATVPRGTLASPAAVAASVLPILPVPPAVHMTTMGEPWRDRSDTVAAAAPAEAVPPEPVAPAAEPVAEPVAVPAPPVTPPPGPPGPPVPAGGSGADPAPQSDSESDAFSVLGSAEFRAGRVSVQSGRQVKTRRPKIGLAGTVELAQRSVARVVLKVSIDAAGNVTNVDVAESSGSNDIDQPCRVAMYDWWFEPRKDRSGRPVPDTFQFTISFR